MRPFATLALVAASVLVSAPAALAGTNTTVTLTFDDTLGDQYDQVRSLLANHGMHATFYVNSGRIGTLNYMTLDQLHTLETDGNEIGGHTVNHFQLTLYDYDEQRRQICNDRANLLGLGFRVISFAYPHGAEDPTTKKIVGECGYNSARGVGDLECTSCAAAETVPPRDMFYIRTPSSIIPSTTIADMQGYVTTAETSGGGWVPLVFHHACDGCNPLSISPTTLNGFLDWLAARAPSGTVMKTVGEVLGGDVQPAVTTPLPAPGPPGTNLIKNPSFETDTNIAGDGIPDCWEFGSVGAPVPALTRTIEAHDGTYAMHIDVANAGEVGRLLIHEDMGACAPTTVALDGYTVSAWYKATSAVRFVAYYRTALGGWTHFTESPDLPASDTYVQGTWTTPGVPADATGLSVGLELLSPGSMTMDDYAMFDTGPAPPKTVKTHQQPGGCGGSNGASMGLVALVLLGMQLRKKRC